MVKEKDKNIHHKYVLEPLIFSLMWPIFMAKCEFKGQKDTHTFQLREEGIKINTCTYVRMYDH